MFQLKTKKRNKMDQWIFTAVSDDYQQLLDEVEHGIEKDPGRNHSAEAENISRGLNNSPYHAKPNPKIV